MCRQLSGLSAAHSSAGKGDARRRSASQHESRIWVDRQRQTETIASGSDLRARPTSIPSELGATIQVCFRPEGPLKPKDLQFGVMLNRLNAHLCSGGPGEQSII